MAGEAFLNPMNEQQTAFCNHLYLTYGEKVSARYKALVESPNYLVGAPKGFSTPIFARETKPKKLLDESTISDLKKKIGDILYNHGHCSIYLCRNSSRILKGLDTDFICDLLRQYAEENNFVRVVPNRRGFPKLEMMVL